MTLALWTTQGLLAAVSYLYSPVLRRPAHRELTHENTDARCQ